MKKSVLIVIYIILILGILLVLTKPVSADTKFFGSINNRYANNIARY